MTSLYVPWSGYGPGSKVSTIPSLSFSFHTPLTSVCSGRGFDQPWYAGNNESLYHIWKYTSNILTGFGVFPQPLIDRVAEWIAEDLLTLFDGDLKSCTGILYVVAEEAMTCHLCMMLDMSKYWLAWHPNPMERPVESGNQLWGFPGVTTSEWATGVFMKPFPLPERMTAARCNEVGPSSVVELVACPCLVLDKYRGDFSAKFTYALPMLVVVYRDEWAKRPLSPLGPLGTRIEDAQPPSDDGAVASA